MSYPNWRIVRLTEKKASLVASSQELLDRLQVEGREPTAGEQKILSENRVVLDELQARLSREISQEEYARTAVAVPVDGPGAGTDGPVDQLRDRHQQQLSLATAGKVGARYQDLFGRELSSDGWQNRQEFFNAVHAGMAHANLVAMTEGGGAGGGWLVPTEYAAEMLDAAMEDSIVLPRARIYPMTTETKRIAGFDASTTAGGTLFGGISAQWLGEGTGGDVTNPKLRKIELRAKKLALFTTSSLELSEDGMNLEGQLDESMRQGNAWFLDYAFLRGTGVGQPLGILNDPALVTVDAEDAQDADSIVYENLCKMLGRLHPGCFNRSVWVVNPTAIPQLLQLYVTTGIGGAPVPVLREVGGGWSILTRPLLMSEKMAALGDAGDILLADLSQYAIGLRKQVTLEKSGHVYFMSDQTAWRAITRVDGQGRWNKPFTPVHGATQSWCVTLAAR
jgi:HK97 family phage major capsid protein